MFTTFQLRKQWRKERTTPDEMIKAVEAGLIIRPVGQDAIAATTAWLVRLREWRDQLDDQLAGIPESS